LFSQFLFVLVSPGLLRLLHCWGFSFLSLLFVVTLLVFSGAVALVEFFRGFFSESGLLFFSGVLVEAELFFDELDGGVNLRNGAGRKKLDCLEVSDSINSMGESVVFGLLLFLFRFLSLLRFFI
jgi:hypothetical protein